MANVDAGITKEVGKLARIDTEVLRQYLEDFRSDLEQSMARLQADIDRFYARRENKRTALRSVLAGLERLDDDEEADRATGEPLIEESYADHMAAVAVDPVATLKANQDLDKEADRAAMRETMGTLGDQDSDRPLLSMKHIFVPTLEGGGRGRDGE